MTFYATTALINAVVCFTTAIFVVSKKYKSFTALMFSALLFSIFAWSFSYFFWQISDNSETALFWARNLSFFDAPIPVLFLHWVLAWIGRNKKIFSRVILYFGYLFTFIVCAFAYTDLIVLSVMNTPFFPYWPKPGSLFFLYPFVIFPLMFGFMFYELIREFFRQKGLRRYQIQYVLIGAVLSVGGGYTNFFLWYNIPIPPIGNILVSVGMFAIFYCLIRYRLMDMRSVANKILVYLVDAIYIYASFYFFVWLFGVLWGSIFTLPAFLSGAMIAPLFSVSLIAVDKGIKDLVNRYFFFSLYDDQKTITKLVQDLNRYLDLETITTLLVNTIKNAMQLDRAGLLLLNSEIKPAKYEATRMVGFDPHTIISLAEDTFLTRYLNETQKVLSQEELDVLYKEATAEEERKSITKLRQEMKNLDALVCLPIVSRSRVLGVIILGPKISKDAYTREDFDLLNTLTIQAGMAIDNAKLYSRLQKLNRVTPANGLRNQPPPL